MTPVRRRRFAWFLDAFVIDGRLAWPVLGLFIAINLLVLTNAILHDPKIGYDASAHLKYATTLALGRLPTDADTDEFFSPPLPYVPLALLWASLDAAGRDGRAEWALKLAQLVQVGYSLGLTFTLVKLARLLKPGAVVPAVALLCLGLLPVYFRTFAMIRGEPLLAMLVLLGIYGTLRTFALHRPTITAGLLLGVTLGLAVLSRQWAFFVLPPLGLVGVWRFFADAENRGATLRSGLVLLATFAVVGAPFYWHLHETYGSIRAFNRHPQSDDDAGDATAKGIVDAGRLLIEKPVRHAFADRPAFLLYADAWGDYWQYFLVYSKDKRGHYAKPGAVARANRNGNAASSNYTTMPAYLGRMAVIGVVPSTLAAIGCVGGLVALRRLRRTDGSVLILPTLAMCALGTAIGYAWFISAYPNDHGDTIKASYPLQLYAPLAVLGAGVVGVVATRWPRVGKGVVVLLVIIAIHNLPACVTRYR